MKIEQGLISALRKYDLKALLIAINKKSTRIAYNKDKNARMGFDAIDVMQIVGKSGLRKRQTIMITAWELIDLAYHAILATNEFRGKESVSDEELLNLFLIDESARRQQEKYQISKVKENDRIFFYVWGFCGEQFRFQTIGEIFQNAAREMYILLDMAPRNGVSYIESQIIEETGVTWQILVSSLFLAWFTFALFDDFHQIIPLIKWDGEFSEETFLTVIDRYSASYKEIRNSPLERQIFYTKPYIKTKTSIVSINIFLNLFLYEHCIYWTIRDKYQREDSQQFTNDFGKLFEAYFEELLETYIEKDNYDRLKEDNEHRQADWSLNLFGYKLLIEQKCSLLGIKAKQQETDIGEIEKYAKRTIIKALHQLQSTEHRRKNGDYIKIILTYEDYLIAEILDSIFDMQECDIENDHRYWLMNISEMEKLLYLYNHNPVKCKEILEEKIRRENGIIPPGAGKRLDCIIAEKGITENPYLQQEQFQKYEHYAEKFLRTRIIDKQTRVDSIF